MSARRLATAIALALTMFAPASATAADGESESISTKRGAVWFNHDGDRLYAEDTKVDGKGIEARITWAGHLESVLEGGAFGRPELLNLDLLEGTFVELQMCYFTHHGLGKCSKPQTAIA